MKVYIRSVIRIEVFKHLSFMIAHKLEFEEDILPKMWGEIWSLTPVLKEIMVKYGQSSLFDYTKGYFDINLTPKLDSRRSEFIILLKDRLKECLGDVVASEVVEQLEKYRLVSTADHHGPIDHPYWVNSNILYALPYLDIQDPLLKYLIVFSFASVSLNNASAFPRGLVFHGNNDSSDDFVRLPILSDKEKMAVVYNMRPFNFADVERAKKQLDGKVQNGIVKHEIGLPVSGILDDYFLDNEVLKLKDFSTQITKINYRMWPKMFHPMGSKKIDLIYLDIESIVTSLILKFHISDSNSLINKLLFQNNFQELFLKYFDEIPGAFSLKSGWGTYMFWGLDENNHRIRFELKDGYLFCADKNCSYEFQPGIIKRALEDKKIFPSMVLCYILVAFYYGYKCLGGFSQVNDLTKTKEAWIALLSDVGELEEINSIAQVQTQDMTAGGIVLSYLNTSKGGFLPATGIDMMVSNRDTSFEHYAKLAKATSLYEMMSPMVVNIYKVLFPEHKRNPDFLNYTPEKIMEIIGLDKKISEI